MALFHSCGTWKTWLYAGIYRRFCSGLEYVGFRVCWTSVCQTSDHVGFQLLDSRLREMRSTIMQKYPKPRLREDEVNEYITISREQTVPPYAIIYDHDESRPAQNPIILSSPPRQPPPPPTLHNPHHPAHLYRLHKSSVSRAIPSITFLASATKLCSSVRNFCPSGVSLSLRFFMRSKAFCVCAKMSSVCALRLAPIARTTLLESSSAQPEKLEKGPVGPGMLSRR